MYSKNLMKNKSLANVYNKKLLVQWNYIEADMCPTPPPPSSLFKEVC